MPALIKTPNSPRMPSMAPQNDLDFANVVPSAQAASCHAANAVCNPHPMQLGDGHTNQQAKSAISHIQRILAALGRALTLIVSMFTASPPSTPAIQTAHQAANHRYRAEKEHYQVLLQRVHELHQECRACMGENDEYENIPPQLANAYTDACEQALECEKRITAMVQAFKTNNYAIICAHDMPGLIKTATR